MPTSEKSSFLFRENRGPGGQDQGRDGHLEGEDGQDGGGDWDIQRPRQTPQRGRGEEEVIHIK